MRGVWHATLFKNIINEYKNLDRIYEGKKSLGRWRYKWKDNIKT
jgi:hypothetical protein